MQCGKSQLKENTWFVGMEHFTGKNVNYKMLEPKESLKDHFSDYFLGSRSSEFQGQMSLKSDRLTGFLPQDLTSL